MVHIVNIETTGIFRNRSAPPIGSGSEGMRDILLGPFGSMGSLNVKLRNICVEDLILEGIFACLSIIRIVFSTRLYELIGAVGSFIGTSMIAIVAGILVMDGSCCVKPVCTCVTDWKLMTVYHTISYAGIAASVLAIICEIMTLLDQDESSSTAIDLPVDIGDYGRIREREIAITVLIIQVFLSIPWRIYAIRVIRGVLEAIHCAEVLKFPSQYDRKILEDLMPTTGVPNGVEIAVESDIPVLAVLQYQAFSAILRHIGLPPDRGPALIEAQWRAKGPAVLKWWLGRVGVVRDADGHVIGALSLQLPGDTAAYRSRMVSHDAIDTSTTRLRPTSSSVDESTTSSQGMGEDSSHHFSWPERQVGCLERMIGPEYVFLGLLNGYRYRYKHAILNDHVCTPGEAYVEFVCTLAGREGEGIGTRLMKWAEQSAEKLGCGRIRLTVMDNDERLRVRYLKYGYTVCSSWTDPIDKMFKKYGFGINENGYCEMEKPLLVDQGKAIHSRTYGFASDLVKLSGSFEDDADISLHAAAQSFIAGTRDFMHSAQSFINRRNQGGVASWTPLESCFQEFSDLESNNSSRDPQDCNHNCLTSSIHSVSSRHPVDSANSGFPDISSASTSSLYDKVVEDTVFSPVSRLGELADPSVGFGAKFSSSGDQAKAAAGRASPASPLQPNALSLEGSNTDSNSRVASPGPTASNSMAAGANKTEPPILRTNSGSPHTTKHSPITINVSFGGRTAPSPTRYLLRGASPGPVNANVSATTTSVSAATNSSGTSGNGSSSSTNDKVGKSESASSGVTRSSSGDSIESSTSSHSSSSSNSSIHGSSVPSGGSGPNNGATKVKFVVSPLSGSNNSNSASPSEFKGKLLSRTGANDENSLSQARVQIVEYEDEDASNHSSTAAGSTAIQSHSSAETLSGGAQVEAAAVSGGTSRAIDGRALVQSI